MLINYSMNQLINAPLHKLFRGATYMHTVHTQNAM